MTRKASRFSLFTLAFLTLLIAVSGCTPSLSEVQAFGNASKALGLSARQALELSDSSTVDRQIYNVAANKAVGPTEGTFTGLFSGHAASLRLRLDVLDHLTNYAAALEALAAADLSKDVDKAATELKGALSGLSASFKKATNSGKDLVSEGELNLIAAAVDAIGKGIIEYKKREAVKAIILQADPAVQKASQLLERELGKSSELATFVTANITNIQAQMQIGYNDERTRATSTFGERLAALRRIQAQALAAHDAPNFFDDVSKGAAKMAKAHAALKSAVQDNEFTSPEVIRSVNELIAIAKSVQKFHESLQPR